MASERIEGTVDRITFRNEQTTYTVIQVELDSGERVTLVGTVASVQPGERVQAEGAWQVHPRYGLQFQAERITSIPPVTATAIERYLSSGLIKGVGPAMAKRLVEAFGDQTLDVMTNSPHKLSEVPGIGPKRAAAIAEAATQQHALRQALLFLQGVGVSLGYAMRIYRQYGEQTIFLVRQNPYRLCTEVHGIGFKRADEIARALGIDENAPERIQAAILHTLNEASNEGHVYLPVDAIRERLKALEVPGDQVDPALQSLADGGRIVLERDEEQRRVYLASLHRAEERIARRLRTLRDAVEPLPLSGLGLIEGDLLLSDEQRRAVELALKHGLLVITGGPGTGKTTTVRAICRAYEQHGLRVALAAPTGRAAQRLAEATGRPAKTIHRLLEVRGGADATGPMFARNEERPLDTDAVIVDEASMVDTLLMQHLLAALRPGTRLLLIGDEDQLPSVGPGQVLGDIIASEQIPCIRLTQVFRQASLSLIVENAHRIRRGELPRTGRPDQDFFFIEVGVDELSDLIVDLVARRLPAYLDRDAVTSIQVLTPVRRGPVGVDALNQRLQERLNPRDTVEVAIGDVVLRPRDKVMQIRNDYDNMVFNGDIGRITYVSPEDRLVEVLFADGDEERRVRYSEDRLDHLILAYATSVHKSQGSEYPCIVMPITWVMPALMTRNLLYTALTRARRLAVLVGDRRALAAYVRNVHAMRRYTGLEERLRSLP